MDTQKQKQLTDLLGQTPKSPMIPAEIFSSLLKVSPAAVVELVVTSDQGKSFLLTMRKDEHFDGWHFPGGFIGYNETFEQACQRIAKRELGVELKNIQFLNVLNYNHGEDPRGHLVALVFMAVPSSAPSVGIYFQAAPEKSIAHVPLIINVIKTYAQK